MEVTGCQNPAENDAYLTSVFTSPPRHNRHNA